MPDHGPSLPQVVAEHFKTLLLHGMERTEALDLTRDFQAAILDNAEAEPDAS